MAKKTNRAECATCAVSKKDRACTQPGGKGSGGCPTLGRATLRKRAHQGYLRKDVADFARQASIQEGEGYAGKEENPPARRPVKPRMKEICEFARKMGYSRLGLAFCAGLASEAAVVDRILKNHGFETVSVVCKAGGVPKEHIGVRDEEKVRPGKHESMCNPILQAMLLNEARVDFNILLGLCVGHDSLFFKYAQAPTSVLAVKDRVTGHNPLACIYTAGSYYAGILTP